MIFKTIKKNALRGFALLLLLDIAACVRYTAPRSEINSKDGNKVHALASTAEFEAHEKRLADKLSQLAATRNNITSTTVQSGYVVGVGDILMLKVFSFSELSSEAEVTSSGTISLPMIGDNIQAAGKPIDELRNDIIRLLKKFVNDPRIQLSVKDYQASKVFVIGEVAKPGTYALKRNGEQLMELISEAGGRTDKASGRVIVIPANSSDKTESSGVEVSMDDLIGNVDAKPLQLPLLGGDTIIVPEAGTVEVYGEVATPGSFKLASRTSALGAIASAGGFTYAAKVDEVEIIRDIGSGKKASIVLNLEDVALKGYKDLRIRDGDVVRVPSESGSFFRRQIVDVINGTFRGVGVTAK